MSQAEADIQALISATKNMKYIFSFWALTAFFVSIFIIYNKIGQQKKQPEYTINGKRVLTRCDIFGKISS